MTKSVLTVIGVVAAAAAVAALAGLAGLPVSGGALGGAIGGVVGVMLIGGEGRRACPRCATALPQTRKPASLKQALWGGWTCPNCGCEADRLGRETLRAN
jgi:hypothetical protein